MIGKRPPLILLALLLLGLALTPVAGALSGSNGKPEACGPPALTGHVTFSDATFRLEANGTPGTPAMLVTQVEATEGSPVTMYMPLTFDAAGRWSFSSSLIALGSIDAFRARFTLVGPPTPGAAQPPVLGTWGLQSHHWGANDPGAPSAPGGTSTQVAYSPGSTFLVDLTRVTIPAISSFDSNNTYTTFVCGPNWTLEGALPVN